MNPIFRFTVAAAALALGGCGAVIEPGHRGLVFDPRHGGLQHDVLGPGYHRLGLRARIDDFDVTFSTRHEELRLLSSEGATINVGVAVIYRPIVSELSDLDVEIGPNYYEEVVGPEVRSTARAFFARHSYLEVPSLTERMEGEVQAAVRKRIAGKHVEVSSVTLENVSYLPALAAALRYPSCNTATILDGGMPRREPITVRAGESW